MVSNRKMSALIALLALSTPAAAHDWPTRPMTMVVPFAAGSGSDIAGRIFAARLSEVLGQQVVVENIGGAGGMTGAQRVARATPDGYQFVLGTAGTHSVNQALYKHPPYDAAVDFTPVILMAEHPTVLIARRDLPVNQLPEFIRFARANQAHMQFGSPGAGSLPHLACVLLNAAAGIEVTHIPYRGANPAMQDLMAGRIDYQCVSLSPTLPQIEDGKVKAIAILSQDRSPSLPNLATAREQAQINLEATTWYAIFTPKATPVAITRRLNEAAVITLNTPAVQQRLTQIGVEPVSAQRMSSEYLKEFVKHEIVKWLRAIKVAGVSAP